MASSYEIQITRLAQKELSVLDKKTYLKIKPTILNLANNPMPPGCKKLENRDAWRIRVGDYRIIYEIHNYRLVIIVIRVAHRKDVYR